MAEGSLEIDIANPYNRAIARDAIPSRMDLKEMEELLRQRRLPR